MSRRAVRGALVSALLLAAGCGADRREAERAVRAYNDAAILAYRTRDFGPLQEVATKGEWGRVVVLVDLKTASRLVLESELQSLEITGVTRPSPEAMVVRSRERWRYHDRPLDPGRPQGQQFVADMVLEYQFAREGGRWKLDRAKTISTEYLEPKGVVPGGAHSP
jgi:hypothetical protein